MDPSHLATKADLAALTNCLTSLLEKALPAVAASDDFLDVQEVAALTGVSTKTVRKWITEGKFDQKGRHIKLYVLEFSPGFPRVPRSALVAYGQGLGYDERQLMPERKATMRAAS
jgi:excisionase family DNA binding protein